MLDETFYRAVLDNLHDGVYFVDRDRRITYWNKGAERIAGYDAEQAVGHRCSDNMLNHVSATGVFLCGDKCPLAAVMADGKVREAQVYLHHADGHRVPVLARGTPMRDENGTIVGAVETFSNNTELVHIHHEMSDLRRSVCQDELTGIGNRRHLEGRLRAVLAECAHTKNLAGLLFMDIDHFKQVNDTYGHDVGDEVLRMVGGTLRQSMRVTDTVGRWGGEEFLAIIHDLPDAQSLQAIAEQLRLAVADSRLDLGPESLVVTIALGASLVRPDDTPESLVRRADQLMYRSKQAGSHHVAMG